MDNQLEIKVSIQVGKPVAEVYDAIAAPSKMNGYFIAKSSGVMEAGKTLVWQFPEFDEQFTVRVDKVEQDKYLSFYWKPDENESLVEISLTPAPGDATVVSITEKSRENNAAGIKWLSGNTEGWANFLACLKAYLEYNINLRKGAFDFMKKAG